MSFVFSLGPALCSLLQHSSNKKMNQERAVCFLFLLVQLFLHLFNSWDSRHILVFSFVVFLGGCQPLLSLPLMLDLTLKPICLVFWFYKYISWALTYSIKEKQERRDLYSGINQSLGHILLLLFYWGREIKDSDSRSQQPSGNALSCSFY